MISDAIIDEIKNDTDYDDQIVFIKKIKKREPRYGTLSFPLSAQLENLLTERGIKKLYTHQAEAIERIHNNENVVIVTSTASGKTLCYTIPVIENLVKNPDEKALFIFPTKALAQDQLRGLSSFSEILFNGRIKANTYDGDTPKHRRKKIRTETSLLLTNPDMLHKAILPSHLKWAQFFENLKYIVLDEIHIYRGVFGSNTANVLRRLNRIAEHYGSAPQYICSSATIANPGELAESLTGRRMQVITNDGSPKGEKTFVFWNPPVDRKKGNVRKSPHIQAQKILVRLIKKRIQTILFTRTRVAAELLYKYTKEYLKKTDNALENAVRSYRGGYLPEERRKIEQMLFNGKLLGVMSTNALELGIDIGTLDACIIVGYPGSITSILQQSGRAGRTKSDSIVFIIAYDDPIDQYVINNPSYFFESSPENAVIDPQNAFILANHLSCAANELPLREGDAHYFGPLTMELITILEDEGLIKRVRDRWFWSRGESPAMRSSLRTASEDTFSILDTTGERKIIGTVDYSSAFMLVHPGAVYIHEGESYYVQSLDMQRKIAYIKKGEFDYYTQPAAFSGVKILANKEDRQLKNVTVCFGDVEVALSIVSFAKIKYYTLERFSIEKLDLPEQKLETSSLWLDFSALDMQYIAYKGVRLLDGLVGIKNLLLVTLPLLSMCDRNDIGGTVDYKDRSLPGIFIYDKYPGGLGFSEKGFTLIEEMLRMGLDVLNKCPCDTGCPSCVGANDLRDAVYRDSDGKGGWLYPNKRAAKIILELMV